MTQAQKAYETIRAHLIKQGRPALDPMTGSCFYRTEGGLKCAVGFLISDEAYHEELEDCTPNTPCVRVALRSSGWEFTENEFNMLRHMQDRHDHWDIDSDDGLEFVTREIDQVAKDYGLELVK